MLCYSLAVSTAAGTGVRPEEGAVLVGRYRLDHLVGEGGSGVVWAAEHVVTGKLVALKILKPSSDSPMWRGRFVREARAACAVRHPNVVTVHDVIEAADGIPALVMDLLEGETLRARLTRGGALSFSEALDILLPVVSAVGTAHASGVVHRDLKPENVFLTREGDGEGVRVLDVGIAKLTAAEGAPRPETLTATGSVIGTIYYMPPEQVYGERDIDHRADVWALGVMIYECLAGRRPTEGENAGQVLKLITSGGIPPLRQVAPHVPADVADLVMRMLTREIDDRPQDLRGVRAALLRYGGAAPSFAEPAQPLSRRGEIEPPESANAPPTALARRQADAPHEGPGATQASPTSKKADTETFEGVGLVSGKASSRRPPRAESPKPPVVRWSRARSIGSLASLLGIAVVAVIAVSARVRTSAAPASAAATESVLTSASALAPLAPLAPRAARAAEEAPPATDAPQAPVPAPSERAPGPHPKAPTLTPLALRGKSAPDAGTRSAEGAPSATAPAYTSHEGIVEKPPF